MTASEDTSKSALEASLHSKKEHSYYYAHQRRATGEEPAPAPVHRVIQRSAPQATDHVEAVFSYQFMDGDKVAKVYVPMDGVGNLSNDLIESSFTEKSMNLQIRGMKQNRTMQLAVAELDGEIVPEGCYHRKMANKVVVTLKKKPTEDGHCISWRNLRK
ncbi:unnamed protein product [Ostreobium quekettii]|uniref:CS domain-containing protein n=1 Tax=Ostreobium quekettii TaxID=121088 RepID=A0A8S1IN46_9CHLO|nr:unnamed protein product [Ostreobium quekettii]|eukprot:evm.model.scf_108.13 EVM.evm.TU.scf_108.13   scf_108:88858-91290(+)